MANPALDMINEIADISEENYFLLDGFEEALLGRATRFGGLSVTAYSLTKCLSILQDQGMSYEDAVEYFDFNVIGAWVGEGTPVFIEFPE